MKTIVLLILFSALPLFSQDYRKSVAIDEVFVSNSTIVLGNFQLVKGMYKRQETPLILQGIKAEKSFTFAKKTGKIVIRKGVLHIDFGGTRPPLVLQATPLADGKLFIWVEDSPTPNYAFSPDLFSNPKTKKVLQTELDALIETLDEDGYTEEG